VRGRGASRSRGSVPAKPHSASETAQCQRTPHSARGNCTVPAKPHSASGAAAQCHRGLEPRLSATESRGSVLPRAAAQCHRESTVSQRSRGSVPPGPAAQCHREPRLSAIEARCTLPPRAAAACYREPRHRATVHGSSPALWPHPPVTNTGGCGPS
jgi:hypothetical protein